MAFALILFRQVEDIAFSELRPSSMWPSKMPCAPGVFDATQTSYHPATIRFIIQAAK